MDTAHNIINRWQEVRREIDRAARGCGRDPAEITLVAVSKTYPAQDVRILAKAGHLDFGENYVQEALDKVDELSDCPIRWHFIGRLQTNKAKFLPGRFALIHSLDRPKTAHILDQRCTQKGLVQPVLLQVNLAGEKQKGGIEADDLMEAARDIDSLPGIDVQGLMCMPPFFDDPEKARPFFSRLAHLRDELQNGLGKKLRQLSMGMSGDYQAAIEEGATLLRIGTSIFGARN